MKLFEALGLNIKLIIINIINLVVLLFILKKIGYDAILKFIEDRTNRIEQGIKNADEAKLALEQAKTEQQAILTAAHKEAQGIMDASRERAVEQATSIVEKSKTEAGTMMDKAKRDIAIERDKAIADAKQDIAELVVMTTEKVLEKKVDTAADKELVQKSLSDVTS